MPDILRDRQLEVSPGVTIGRVETATIADFSCTVSFRGKTVPAFSAGKNPLAIGDTVTLAEIQGMNWVIASTADYPARFSRKLSEWGPDHKAALALQYFVRNCQKDYTFRLGNAVSVVSTNVLRVACWDGKSRDLQIEYAGVPKLASDFSPTDVVVCYQKAAGNWVVIGKNVSGPNQGRIIVNYLYGNTGIAPFPLLSQWSDSEWNGQSELFLRNCMEYLVGSSDFSGTILLWDTSLLNFFLGSSTSFQAWVNTNFPVNVDKLQTAWTAGDITSSSLIIGGLGVAGFTNIETAITAKISSMLILSNFSTSEYCPKFGYITANWDASLPTLGHITVFPADAIFTSLTDIHRGAWSMILDEPWAAPTGWTPFFQRDYTHPAFKYYGFLKYQEP